MVNKITALLDEIVGDFLSCWNLAKYIVKSPPIDKRVAIIGLIIVLLTPFSAISTGSGILLYFVYALFATFITFLILAWSNTFWFLMKKSWMYKFHIKTRKSIRYFLKDVKTLQLDSPEADNSEGALYVISYFNSEGYKYHAIRHAIEVYILMLLLFYVLPLFFVFNVAIICLQFFYVMIFDNQSSSQVINDIKILIFCIHKLYALNPEECKKLIFKNTMKQMRELGTIYKTVASDSK